MPTSEQFYAMICYLTIISTTDNWDQKHPNYLAEKMEMLGEGLNAFAYLDYLNMIRAVEYLRTMGVTIPQAWIDELKAQLDAKEELEKAGIHLI